MYIVTRPFTDLSDNNRMYKVGDTYPAEGVKPTKARVKELLTGNNKNRKVYLSEVADPAPASAPTPDQTPDTNANPEVTPDVTPDRTPDQTPAEPEQNPEE